MLWNECKDKYFIVGLRDSASLNILYPPENKRYIRIKIWKRDTVIGWAVLLDTKMNKHKYFGSMRVGTIVDCFAKNKYALPVIKCSTKYLNQKGVDIISSNQGHHSWGRALKQSGFLSGPSNYLFAVSKKVEELLHPFKENSNQFHINRGDGAGPLNL